MGRRALLGMPATGAAGLAAAPYLQRGWEGFLSSASRVDATGITGLLADPGGFRDYSVVGSVSRKDAMVPGTAWTATPGATYADTAPDRQPRKTPSNAAYPRISAGEDLRRNACTRERRSPGRRGAGRGTVSHGFITSQTGYR